MVAPAGSDRANPGSGDNPYAADLSMGAPSVWHSGGESDSIASKPRDR